MAKEDNLRPYDSKRAKENQPKSVQSRLRNKKERQTTAGVLTALLDSVVTDPAHLAAMEKLGLKKGATYREFYAAAVVIRGIQKGRIDDLEKIQAITGEVTDKPNDEGVKIIIDV